MLLGPPVALEQVREVRHLFTAAAAFGDQHRIYDGCRGCQDRRPDQQRTDREIGAVVETEQALDQGGVGHGRGGDELEHPTGDTYQHRDGEEREAEFDGAQPLVQIALRGFGEQKPKVVVAEFEAAA